MSPHPEPSLNSTSLKPKVLAKHRTSWSWMTSSAGSSTRSPASRRSDVTSLPAMPQGKMCSKYPRSGSILNASPCHVNPDEILTPTAPILRSPTHTPVSPGSPGRAETPWSAATSIIADSRPSTYLRAPRPRARSERTGYSTACRGPWKVTSPPRSVRWISAPRARSSCSGARRLRSAFLRCLPRVYVGGAAATARGRRRCRPCGPRPAAPGAGARRRT
uniref:LIP2 n=1 Tax=Arundo donax TaxID=35708 RepID=A0A0A9DKU9_ARUDO